MCESRLARGATSAVHPPKIIKYHTHKQRHTELVTMTIPSGRKRQSFLTPCVLIPSCGKKEFSQMSRYNSHSKTNRPPPSSDDNPPVRYPQAATPLLKWPPAAPAGGGRWQARQLTMSAASALPSASVYGVVVVGGGVAGVQAAAHCKLKHLRFLLVEASPSLGGVWASHGERTLAHTRIPARVRLGCGIPALHIRKLARQRWWST